MVEHVECIVVGAGAVGLAVARRLAQSGREVIVLEATDRIGSGVSSRSSEVIHAGIYYPPGSLKARLCVEGRRLLYAYCAERGVDARRVGKFIVATSKDQTAVLDGLRQTSLKNGVDDIEVWTPEAFKREEPDVVCEAVLFSPSTGILDSAGYMLALRGDLEAASGAIAFESPFEGARVTQDGFLVNAGGDQPLELECDVLVNAGGLKAVEIASQIEGAARDKIPKPHFAQGAYFTVSARRTPFRHLIYPVPEPGGLGVHVTLDLGGQARFGPDVLWVPEPVYDVGSARADKFYAAIRSYWPDLRDGELTFSYAGVRPKISGPNEPAADFLVQGPSETGVRGLVNLLGIESPGLTSSLAIANEVASLVTD
jgi:L-2-hydroxyglutarate oxidase LhgO